MDGMNDVVGVQEWLDALEQAGYNFPAIPESNWNAWWRVQLAVTSKWALNDSFGFVTSVVKNQLIAVWETISSYLEYEVHVIHFQCSRCNDSSVRSLPTGITPLVVHFLANESRGTGIHETASHVMWRHHEGDHNVLPYICRDGVLSHTR